MRRYRQCVLLVLIGTIFLQGCRSSSCSGTNCQACISSSFSCSWCTQKVFQGSRCDSKENLLKAGCPENLIDNPQGETRTLQNYEVRDSTANNPKAIQVQPQRVTIKTRPRQEHSIPMTFRAANNFPVDLYFLFDNSVSMESAINSVAKLVNDIGRAIGDISRNYKMGYGVFQDKVILPFTDTSPKMLKNPCDSKRMRDIVCDPPFEFRHVLSMTSDLARLKEHIHTNTTHLTGNIDHPEGSLDALMQAVKCTAELGWRNESRKLLIFASNGPFKTAGAGKIAGIVIPNDGSCHLDGKMEYDWQTKQDYPSVSQLIDAVDSHEVHVIFAVTDKQKDMFWKLSQRIPNSVVEPLSEKSDNKNIKDTIERKYKEMISAVEIKHNNVPGVDIQIKALSDECKPMGTNACKPLKIGRKIEFQVNVKVTECPKEPEDRRKKVILNPDFLKKETLEIDLEIICDCDCDSNSTHWEVDSDVCSNGNGTLKCGSCDCKKDRFGEFCQCDSTDVDSSSSNCIQPENNSTVCSGTGTCKCGVCQCDEGYSGPFCQCNDKACGTFQREICGGARGRCACGECQCEEGYEGNACECPTSNATCIQNGEVCNGVGTCECGKCECDKKYTGMFCQNCFLCSEDPCDVESYRACAQCALVDTDSEDCVSLGCPPVELVNSLGGIDGSVCSIKQADGCFLQFVTEASERNITLYVQRTKTCPQPVDVIPIIAGVIGGVVAVGILLLILWKILTSLFDKIEYSKFQEDVKDCKWAQQDNPFYKGATTTYRNPTLDTSQNLD